MTSKQRACSRAFVNLMDRFVSKLFVFTPCHHAFINQQTGHGWQNAPQATMGGLENLETIAVFPRPGLAPNQQQQQQLSPWG